MPCSNSICLSTAQFPIIQPTTTTNSRKNLSIIQTRTTQLTLIASIEYGPDDSLPLPHHVKSITSTSNPFVKHCFKLRHSSSYRHSHGSVLVVGSTPIREICRFQESTLERPNTINCLLVLDKSDVPKELDADDIRIIHVGEAVMKKLSGVQSTESLKAIALMRIPSTFHILHDNQKDEDYSKWFPSPHRILVLDGIQDPGNLGTLLRSAMAFGWGGVFLLPGCCDPFNDKALRASRGASFQIPIVSGRWIHLQDLMNKYKMKILAAQPESSSEESKPVSLLSQGLADSLAESKLCLVLGSEGIGLSNQTKEVCELVSIPMVAQFESLNVSVAGGIFLYALQPKTQRFT